MLGILSSYIYAQKLDPYGNKVWQQPVVVHHNDTSDMFISGESERNWFCSDGDGGVIVFWQDYRGTYYAQDGPKNSTTHIQRIDKNGNVQWGVNGVKVNNLQDGFKQARITADGQGGCVLLLSEIGFEYPNAPNKNYLKIVRYNSEGQRVWHTVLDSSFTIGTQFQLTDIYRGGNYYYFRFYNGGYVQRKINAKGEINSYSYLPTTILATPPSASTIFFNEYSLTNYTYKVSKLNSNSDTIWSKIVYWENFCTDKGGALLPDHLGGVFLLHVCRDTLIYLDSTGNIFYKKFEGVEIGGYFLDGNGGLVVANNTIVNRFDSSGINLWLNGIVYLSDPSNAYFKYYKPDNNGGLLISFWTTIGGIYVQHTGRTGKIGIITKVINIASNAPDSYELFQNYPNPFNPTTKIKFSISRVSEIELKIFDVLGRKVETFVNGKYSSGVYEIVWDGSNYSNGVYFYNLVVNNKSVVTKKMILTK
ncbi:MAG: T9SS type A sorting domain-containing protein [Bacteriovoracaceae bacterium]